METSQAMLELKLTAGIYLKLSDPDQAKPLMQRLASHEEAVLLEAVKCLRLVMTCSRAQKTTAVQLGIPQRLISILEHHNTISSELAVQIISTLSSFLHNNPSERTIGSSLLPLLLQMLNHQPSDPALLSAISRCCRLLFLSAAYREELTKLIAAQPERLRSLLAFMSSSPDICQVVCELMAVEPDLLSLCLGKNLLLSSRLDSYDFNLPIECILDLLSFKQFEAKKGALCLVSSCVQRNELRPAFTKACLQYKELFCRNLLVLIGPEETAEIRLLALNAIVVLYRKNFPICDGAFIITKVLPFLAKLCRKDQPINIKVSAAETLAYLVDEDVFLQEIASYTDQLLVSLAAFLKTPAEDWKRMTAEERRANQMVSLTECGQELKRVAFLAFSSLASTSESVRKRVADVEGLMEQVVKCSAMQSSPLVYAALRLLHSMSRSIYQLRTIFKDHNIWETVLGALKGKHGLQVTVIASAILANVSVEFSPCHLNLIKKGLWASLGTLLVHSNDDVVLNAVWTLMNMTYMATSSVKKDVEEVLSISLVDDLLHHRSKDVVAVTVGTLRNLLHAPTSSSSGEYPATPRQPDIATRILRRLRRDVHSQSSSTETENNHRDVMESCYCQDLLLHLLTLLQSEYIDVDVLEQGLCALANVCASNKGKQLVLNNSDCLNVIKKGLSHPEVVIKNSAVFCIGNLAACRDECNGREDKHSGSSENQRKVIESNFGKELKKLSGTDDPLLFER
ncbi:hypothetical protein RvY_11969-2 [Ramazzottius varieornatus]|nr:hypothetical protein RvY_11969-2 [Ramazzottius varieornatus]